MALYLALQISKWAGRFVTEQWPDQLAKQASVILQAFKSVSKTAVVKILHITDGHMIDTKTIKMLYLVIMVPKAFCLFVVI